MKKEDEKLQPLRGLFEGANLDHAQINVIVAPVGNINNGCSTSNNQESSKIVMSKELLAKCIPHLVAHMWAASSYAVFFGVSRDCYNYPDNMSQFAEEMGDMELPPRLKYRCTESALDDAFRNNPYFKLPVNKWKENGAKSRVLVLVDQFQETVENVIRTQSEELLQD